MWLSEIMIWDFIFRECRVVKSEHYSGYGFNLYQEKNKPGQFIGRIEPGSPADKAGLKENDR